MGLLDNYTKKNTLDKIINATEEKKTYGDNEFYFPERQNRTKSCSVDFRFLPQKNPDAVPWVMTYSHNYKGNDGRWVINELCPTTFGKHCPICEKNRELYSTGDEQKKSVASNRGRKKKYICNILILKDTLNPENEGKVFPFKFGPSIFKIIQNCFKPEMEGDPIINPFDVMEGANFNLRVVYDKTKDQISYESSKFYEPSPLYGGDVAKIEKVLAQLIDLDERYKTPSLLRNEHDLEALAERSYGTNSSYAKQSAEADKIVASKTFTTDPDFGNSVDAGGLDESSMDDVLAEFTAQIEKMGV